MVLTKLSIQENIERVQLLKECYKQYSTTMKKIKRPTYSFGVANLEKKVIRIIIVQITLQILPHQ
jgi:hypothetical protein